MSKKLAEYERKRDRRKTPEPFGSKARGSAPIFVVQRHDARRLHYDFRLERDGVLASWAVPKGVPLEPGAQHLAVHVEDHPLEYGSFEGEIPAGNYGAGTVEIWDRGTYELVEEKHDGGLTVRLHGERLEGTWALVPAHLSGDEKNWLILRKREDAAASASSRRTYRPMLASLVEDLPSGTGWLFEPKWDGYRAVGYVRGGDATLRSRNGNDLTERFAAVAKELPKALRTPDAVVDGEVCALDENGRPSFSAMQQGKPGTPLVYEIFDVLEIDGEALLDLPLTERRERLEQLAVPSRTVQVSGSFEDGEALLEAAREQGLEGVMAKKAKSRYQEGRRGGDWLKIKTHGRQEFVICGWTKGQGKRAGRFGSLVLGVRRGREYAWVGNCGTGFSERDIDDLLAKLKPLRRATTPFPAEPKMPKIRKGDVVWVEPELVCEVEFLEWTHDGHLRAPSFQGLRDDKPARAVRREAPVEVEDHGVKLSNLDKIFWPDDDPSGPITKGDLLDYYRTVAPVLVPHLRGRPFTMRRYPDGAYGKAFFQKDAPKGTPEWIERFRLQVSTRERPPKRRWIEAPLVNDARALLWMANMGCIDMNAWYSRVDKPERPDFVLFDLDPSPDVGFKEVVQVALIVKQALDALGLTSFPKTSSAEGMHILVPIERRSTYAQTREFCEIVAGAIAGAHRGLATTEWSKAKRRGVLIDANQNGEGKTIASVYSVRPRPGAPVSTPLRWDEVKESLDPTSFTMDVVLDRIRRHGDLFGGVLTTRQRLAPALRSLSS
ncbi:MAG TPA: DNA ligase D [Gaiellaceae bacterium]|nr:DNA ligase D [Gaiellaceae bacterium]